ncbi:MAG: hypothetical protein SW833_01555 [Cyanobacteriota bacterium]|nr:hypothetical protein [Cyanobacteriota bacterium]
MSRRTPAETSQASKPHPTLSAALSCMDVQLEAELARYRRQRADRGESPAASTSPQSLILPALTVDPAGAIVPSPLPAQQPDRETEFEPPSEGDGIPLPPIESPSQLDEPTPDDYLESSEQLLRDLEQESNSQETAPTPTLTKRLLSPLGVGSMLLVLVAATLLGAAILDPGIVSRLGGDRWFKPTTTPVAGNSDSPPSPDATAQPSDSEQLKLDTDEFVELDIDNLSTIEPSPSPSVAALPDAAPVPSPDGAPVVLPGAVPGNPSNLTRALISPTEPAASEANPPEAASPAPAPQNVTVAPPPPPGDRFYYVTANYSDAASLQRARTIVPDAYARTFNSEPGIQMGAFLREEDAKRLVEQLRGQGLAATIYHQ